MRWENRRQSSNVEDRRGMSAGKKGTGIVGIIVLLIGMYYGVDLSGIVGAPQLGSGQVQQSALPPQEEEQLNQLSRVVMAETEDSWGQYFQSKGTKYTVPTLVLYNGYTTTSCGTGQAAMGPFYCPNDQKVYLDLSFYEDLKNKLGAQGGAAAFAYVIAHEVGHHVQNLLGVLPQVHQAQSRSNEAQSNELSVRLELQADCFAGVWAKSAEKDGMWEQTDMAQAIDAAEAVGDDRIQKRAQGYAVPDSFTHGSAEQRKTWFQRGFVNGDPNQCNTFS
ncbi:KPN_02809 family neutral zinc metallopeptidase [Stenoxybacter acetivorans]|uniref:KPN_02809 family neutral zinc metallopeptidase n=1 Tax=Stenoxybacter acetivorans TaxID=422441 RepID=UPI00056A7876|nr:neutral zinc metallopeptidase [Stenoxybacter acetivorans]